MNPSMLQITATVLFAVAVIHTFMVKRFEDLAHKYPKGSIGENLFHFLGEVEAVFGIWAAVFICAYTAVDGFAVYDSHHHVIGGAIHYLESLNFTEPMFVFVIMSVSATRPVIVLAEKIIKGLSNIIPLPNKMAFYVSALIFGPLLGSFITEPAAMTVTALILKDVFFDRGMSTKFKYATLGLLFVNISIGGTLTHFAAPPVLMVAAKWHWGFGFMIRHFGYKAICSVITCTVLTTWFFRDELKDDLKLNPSTGALPAWVTIVHLITLALVVLSNHHPVFFMGLFLFFMGFVTITQEYQTPLKLKESLLVGFFLAGLVTLGFMQKWWLQPLLSRLGDLTLYFGATGLTAITDNAALTYLGSLVEGISDSAKYFLVAGAVTGGGLTVIANAPNPAGYGILKGSFGEAGISPLGLLAGAIIPTCISLVYFYFLP